MWISLTIFLLSLGRFSRSQDANLWTHPPQPGLNGDYSFDLAFELGSVVTLEWSVTYDSYKIHLFQQSLPVDGSDYISDIYTAEGDGAGTTSQDWTVSADGADLSQSNVFYLDIDPMNGDPTYTCHYFNITTKPVASTSSSPAKTSQSTTSAAASTPSSSGGAAATKSPDTNSNVLKVGLGVGLGVGIPLILVAGLYFGMVAMKRRRSRNANRLYTGLPDIKYEQEPGLYSSQPPYLSGEHYELAAKHEMPDIYEAPGHVDVPELPSGRK